MTIADVHFAIGKTHDVCQDYGIADDPGQSDLSAPLAYAVICDGCSSSKDTDIGARLLARAAVSTHPFDAYEVGRRADRLREALELDPTALDATLIMVQETPEGDAKVTICGDGIVVARRRDGTGYAHWALSFNNNAPAYITYLLDPERFVSYQEAGCGLMISKGDEYPQEDDTQEGVHFHHIFSRAEYDVVMVMSDGAESFQRRDGTRLVPVPLADVLDQVLDLKVLTHGFLRRRMGKFLGKFCTDNGWQHYDDFAVAGLVLDPPKEATP